MSHSDGLRVLIAPDCYGDSLTAVLAAEAIADGWRQARPDDELTLAPQSDGGPGFVDVLVGRLGERRTLRTAEGWASSSRPRLRPVRAALWSGSAAVRAPTAAEAWSRLWVRTRGAQEAIASVRPARCWPTWR